MLVALLYAPGGNDRPAEEIRGITRLEKLVFLALEEGGFRSQTKDYQYKAYDFGPYSKEVIDYLAALRGASLLDVKESKFENFREVVDQVMAAGEVPGEAEAGTVEIYSLTEKGMKVGRRTFERLSSEEQSLIRDIKRRYNQMELAELLKQVYKKYPGMTRKSKILDEILGLGTRKGLKIPARED